MMEELKRYLSPSMEIISMQQRDVLTLSNPETDNDNDNVFEDIYG